MAEIDPICGMSVTVKDDTPSFEWEGKTTWFCCVSCRDKFAGQKTGKAPPMIQFGGGLQAAMEKKAPPAGKYFCPMCPGVSSDVPASCPKCGMALESAEGDGDSSGELGEMTWRFWLSLVLTLPVFVMAMLETGTSRIFLWAQLVLATPVLFCCGWPFFVRAWDSLRNRSPNMFTLIALGTGIAYDYSVAAVLFPGWFPDALKNADGLVPVYFEASAVIVTLVLLGQVLELRARERTSGAIRALLDLVPEKARRILGNGEEEDIPLDEVLVGNLLRVLPGSNVPVDGMVTEGESEIEESMVTGESIPVRREPGDPLIGGTRNGTGSLVMKAGRVGSETLLARIVERVKEAQRTRAPVQKIADRVSGWFVPAVVLISLVTFVVWILAGPSPSLGLALVSAVSVLIIACPCALGLATPMSIMVAMGRGATSGILIRDAEALETFEKIDTIVFDKTGTLTHGEIEMASLRVEPGFTEEQVLELAGSLERHSEHPHAGAIVREFPGKPLPVADFRAQPGLGVSGRVGQHTVLIGNARLMGGNGISVSGGHIFVAVDGLLAGSLFMADRVRESARGVVSELKKEGLRVVMLTGDQRAVADKVASEVGIDEVIAEVLPTDKGDVIKRLRDEGSRVAMAGDGINDAPALASSDVGIAMGTGTDVAIQSADITLVGGDLHGILRARRLSRATMRNIRQNLFFAFAYNVVGVPIAAGVLYPVLHVLLSPMIASAAMSLSSVSVIGNALRLRRAD